MFLKSAAVFDYVFFFFSSDGLKRACWMDQLQAIRDTFHMGLLCLSRMPDRKESGHFARHPNQTLMLNTRLMESFVGSTGLAHCFFGSVSVTFLLSHNGTIVSLDH